MYNFAGLFIRTLKEDFRDENDDAVAEYGKGDTLKYPHFKSIYIWFNADINDGKQTEHDVRHDDIGHYCPDIERGMPTVQPIYNKIIHRANQQADRQIPNKQDGNAFGMDFTIVGCKY